MAVHNQIHNQILRPGNLSELFSLWNRFPNAVPLAGGTELIRSFRSRVKGNYSNSPQEDGGTGACMQSGSAPDSACRVYREQPVLPEEILSLEKIEELRNITRTERYLEIGAMVLLGEIIALGKIVPNAFSLTLQGIAGPLVRNMATIGGNICSGGDTIASLCALDAVLEIRNSGGSRWIPALRFCSMPENLKKCELLTRIRIPLEEWSYTVYRKFSTFGSESPEHSFTAPASDLPVKDADSRDNGGVLILIVQNQKNMLTSINVVFAGDLLLRDKDSESFLEGKALPLDRRDAGHYRKFWEAYLDNLKYPGLLLRDKILNAIEMGIAGLSD
ncbi:MAG: FAD binding domain-containing protein [Treponema sp.]|nr:FAD binding domain-containing protein [Treponema sp.]